LSDTKFLNVINIVVLTFSRLCELFEVETKKYLIKDPDHFDDYHPSRIDPNCILGKMYEILFRKDSLMNKVDIKINTYFYFIKLI